MSERGRRDPLLAGELAGRGDVGAERGRRGVLLLMGLIGSLGGGRGWEVPNGWCGGCRLRLRGSRDAGEGEDQEEDEEGSGRHCGRAGGDGSYGAVRISLFWY